MERRLTAAPTAVTETPYYYGRRTSEYRTMKIQKARRAVRSPQGKRFSTGFATFALLALVACTRDNPPGTGVPPPHAAPDSPPPAAPAPAAAGLRALGQEPGWLLEIRPDREIDFSYDYGEKRVSTPVPVPEMSGRQTVYHAVTEANDPPSGCRPGIRTSR